MVRSLTLRLEDRRIAGHLRAVERLLRDRDTGGMSRWLKRRRAEMLDRLAGYTERGVFPRNRSGSLLTPVFVDSDGRTCAVAHLMGDKVDSVGEISGSHNLARIKGIPHPALATWQQRSGLDLDELALIQPAYPETASSVAMAAIDPSENDLARDRVIEIVGAYSMVDAFVDFANNPTTETFSNLPQSLDEYTVQVGEHSRCAAPPQPPPSGLEDRRRVSVQPLGESIDSCLDWTSVDFFVDQSGQVEAITMDLWEP